jgi:hypothetical protein
MNVVVSIKNDCFSAEFVTSTVILLLYFSLRQTRQKLVNTDGILQTSQYRRNYINAVIINQKHNSVFEWEVRDQTHQGYVWKTDKWGINFSPYFTEIKLFLASLQFIPQSNITRGLKDMSYVLFSWIYIPKKVWI